MKFIIHIIFFFTLLSCSTVSKKPLRFIENLEENCEAVTSLEAKSFNVIPGLARPVARSRLKKKARKYGANTIIINEQSGLFLYEIDASGFYCQP